MACDPCILLLGVHPREILRQDHEEPSMRAAYHSANFGTKELKFNLEKCAHRDGMDTHCAMPCST